MPAFITKDGKRLISGSDHVLFVWKMENILKKIVKNARRVDLGSSGCGGMDMGSSGVLVGCV